MKAVKNALIITLIIGGLVLIVNQAFLYSSDTTHPYLTEEIVRFYNYYYDPDITIEQLEKMKEGSTHEDFGDRSVWYHFYDPIYNVGNIKGVTAKQWAQNPERQAATLGGDHSWQTAISEYNAGYKQKAFYSLGHILHLIEDMAVPAHTRNDAHYNGGDPLENWAGDLPHDSNFYNIAEPLYKNGIKPKIFNNLDIYFDNVAMFSNQNFFSKQSIDKTINEYGEIKSKAKYSEPKIVKEIFNTKYIGYAYGKVDNYPGLVHLLKIEKSDRGDKTYFLDDTTPAIHADYFSILSKEAVINGAGVIKLFFDSTTEPEQEIVKPEKELSFWQKIGNTVVGGVKFVVSVVDGLIHVPPSAIDSVIEESIPEPEYLATSPLIAENLKKNSQENTPPLSESTVTEQTSIKPLPQSESQEPEQQEQQSSSAEETTAGNQSTSQSSSGRMGHSSGGGGGSPTPEQPQPSEEQSPQEDTTPPESPIIGFYTNNQIVSGSADFDLAIEGVQINLSGSAEPASTIIIEQNPVYQASVSEEGAWSQVVTLNEGENNFKIKARDKAGNESQEAVFTINLDSTPPEIMISILDFNYASSSLTIQWSSPEYPSVSFEVEYKEGENDWQKLEDTTETQAIFAIENEDITYYFRARATDLLGNQSAWQETSIEILSKPVVINEIAWMGTKADSDDEWLELYNRADYDIDLTGWKLKASDNNPEIIFVTGDINEEKKEKTTVNKKISAKGHYLIERMSKKDKADKTTSLPADWYGSFRQDGTFASGGLDNKGEALELRDNANNLIDFVDTWHAGDNESKKTMERINPDRPGTESGNWLTYIGSGSSATDAGGNQILGTPKAQNSVYKIYTKVNKTITEDTIWTLKNSPYLVYDNRGSDYDLLEIAQGATLTIEAGVIVKFINPGLKVFGTIKAEGTSSKPIVFTDSGAIPRAGSWSGIWITGSSTGSTFDNIIIRYAGNRSRPSDGYTYSQKAVGAGIRVENTSITLRNSTIENNLFKGVWLINSPDTIIENTIFKDHLKYECPSPCTWPDWSKNIALYIDLSNPQVRNSTFQNNITGIYMTNESQPIIENNQFSNNLRPVWVENSYPKFSNNQIEGNNWDGIVLKGLKLNQDYTLGGGSVFINYDEIPSWSIVVPEGFTLTIEPGTIIKSAYPSSLTIKGTLIAKGTAENPIIFTSFYDDEYGGDTNGDGDATAARAGSWGQLIFASTSTNSILDYAVFRYGGTKWGESYNYRLDYVLRIEEGASLTLNEDNLIFENNTNDILDLRPDVK